MLSWLGALSWIKLLLAVLISRAIQHCKTMTRISGVIIGTETTEMFEWLDMIRLFAIAVDEV